MLGPERRDLGVVDVAAEQVALDRLGRDEDVVVAAADLRREPPHVFAVGDHRVGVAVDVARDRQRQRVA